MAKALISIDYTYDFVADDGKLTAGKSAQAIENEIAQLTQEAFENGDYIFFAIDGHDEGDDFHPETKLFPPHNIRGSKGRHLYGELGVVYENIKSDSRVFWMDKRHYSAFSGTDLDIRLRERHVTTIILTGVLTDICVLHTAIDAYNLGYKLEIPAAAVASLTKENHDWALSHFQNVLGAKIIE
ncbi:cysteine hydrolase family protein [Streptococcus orisratti]